MRDDLLRKHIERVAEVTAGFDLAVDHSTRDDCCFKEVATMLREDRPSRRLANLVACATNALQATADRTRRFDLDDQVDSAHINAKFERRRGHDGPEFATFQLVFDDHSLLACQRSVVCPDELFDHVTGLGIDNARYALLHGELVEFRRQPLSCASSVAEDDRGPVCQDPFENLRVDARPDRRA